MATEEKVLEILDMLTAAYDREPTDGQVKAFLRVFAGLAAREISDQALEAGAVDWLATSKWMPSVAELREAATRATAWGGPHEFEQPAETVDPLEVLQRLELQARAGDVQADQFHGLAGLLRQYHRDQLADYVIERLERLSHPSQIDYAADVEAAYARAAAV